MIQRDGANQDIKCDLALGLGNIASLLVSRGEPMEALTVCQEGVDSLNALDATADDGNKAQLALGRILETYGSAAEFLHRYDEALETFDQTPSIFEKANAKLSSDTGVKQALCRVLTRFGSLLINTRRYPDALNAYQRARTVLTAAYQANPSDSTWGVELTADLEAIGYVFSAQKMAGVELYSYKEARGILEKLRRLHPESHEVDETFAGSELLSGKIFRRPGERKEEQVRFEQG